MRLPTRLATLSVLIALLGACGFQMRGSVNLPAAMNQTEISGISDNSDLARELELVLGGNGVSVVEEAGTATLKVTANRLDRDVLAVGTNSEVREFILNYVVRFEVAGEGGAELVPSQTLTLSREYTFDTDQLLSATSEEEFLRAEMTREMARRIVEQIGLLSR